MFLFLSLSCNALNLYLCFAGEPILFDVQCTLFFVLLCTLSKHIAEDCKKTKKNTSKFVILLTVEIEFNNPLLWWNQLKCQANFDSLIYRRELNDIQCFVQNTFSFAIPLTKIFWQMISIDELCSNLYWHSLQSNRLWICIHRCDTSCKLNEIISDLILLSNDDCVQFTGKAIFFFSVRFFRVFFSAFSFAVTGLFQTFVSTNFDVCPLTCWILLWLTH